MGLPAYPGQGKMLDGHVPLSTSYQNNWGKPCHDFMVTIIILIIYQHSKGSHYVGLDVRNGYDITRDAELQNLCSDYGFLQSLFLLLRIRPFGLAWLAIPCNSFSFMASSLHGRGFFCPFGNWGLYDWVRKGNVICSRSCIIIAVAVARSVLWFVENPLNSSLPYFPYLHHLMQQPWLGSVRASWWQPHLNRAKTATFRFIQVQMLSDLNTFFDFFVDFWGQTKINLAKEDGILRGVFPEATTWTFQCEPSLKKVHVVCFKG